jgi:uridine kinase
MLEQVSAYILHQKTNHPLRVAIDGIDAAGKSKLTKELIFPLKKSGRPIIQVSLDNFHNPTHIRYRRGKDSPEGYYYDSYNYEALIDNVLDPISPRGNRKIKKVLFNIVTNSVIDSDYEVVEENAIILFDGIFLMRPELVKYWDVSIFVDITLDTAMYRAYEREKLNGLSYEEIHALYEKRYFGGQKIYFERCSPHQRVNLIVDNNDFKNPMITIKKPLKTST